MYCFKGSITCVGELRFRRYMLDMRFKYTWITLGLLSIAVLPALVWWADPTVYIKLQFVFVLIVVYPLIAIYLGRTPRGSSHEP